MGGDSLELVFVVVRFEGGGEEEGVGCGGLRVCIWFDTLLEGDRAMLLGVSR